MPTEAPSHAVAALLAVSVVACIGVAACGGAGDGGPVSAVESCAGCHVAQATAAENESSHSLLYDCEFCHAARGTEPGPGHRDTPACATCHSEASHPEPPSATLATVAGPSCTRCHEPHGSPNLFLIRREIELIAGGVAAIDLRNALGRADFGFAELPASEGGTNGSEPGAGLCEVCHTSTRYYDSRGTGAAHHIERCSRCHSHARSFGVQ